MSLTTFVYCVFAKVEILGATAPQFLTGLVQLVAPSSDSDMYQAFTVRGKLITKSNGRTFRGIVAATARPDEQR